MLHFLTGMYYFTWFENLLIIIAGLSLGHFLRLIVQQVVTIRNHKSLTKIIRTMIPWLVLLLVLMLSPVFASGIAVGWMVIIGLLECVIEQAVLTKFGQQLTQQRAEHRPAQQHAEHLVHRHSSDRPVERSAAKQSRTPEHEHEHEQTVKSSSVAKQSQSAESAAKPAAPAAQQPVKSAESASTAERQSPAVTNQAASTTATTESQPETSTPESHQPTSQEIMDHMFDFDPNVDYEAEAKAAAAADRQNQEENEHGKD